MGWIKPHWETLLDALGVRKYIAIFVAIGGAGLLAAGYELLSAQAVLSWLPDIPGLAFFLIALLFFLLAAIVPYATALRLEKSPKLQVELGPPWLNFRGLNAPQTVDIKLINDSSEQIVDVRVVLMELRNKQEGSFQPLNVHWSCGPINQGDYEIVTLGECFNPEEDKGAAFERLLFRKDDRWAAMPDEGAVRFSVSAKGISRREYTIGLKCKVRETGNDTQRRRILIAQGLPELVD